MPGFKPCWMGVAATVLALLAGCSTVPGPVSREAPARPAESKPFPPAQAPSAPPAPDAGVGEKPLIEGEALREFEQGQASWYGPRFHGRRTASGERYNQHAMTAAHKTLPFGTLVRVRSLRTGREVDVRINDRGPYAKGRVIDMSRAAAEALGMLGLGVKDVLLLVPESTPPVLASAPRKAGKTVRRAAKRPATPTRPR
ncbi:septal ring lytic transglycosylase RlpA family protein [Polaromonas sp.]|uniref:septal ring lytic transglycosylase RlpA family protein n=1 Tax=Polaromonas sp. TaxID=1869339 RepID=UPI002FC99B01